MVKWISKLLGLIPEAVVRSTTENHNTVGRLNSLLEATADATVGVDAKGRIAFANVQTERLFGYSQDELLGLPVEKLLPRVFEVGGLGRRSLFLADPRTQRMGEVPELRARRKDGTEFPVEVGVSRFTHDDLVAIFFIGDITDIVYAEKALLDSREEFRSVVESAPDAMVIVDVGGQIRLVNAQTEKIFGYSREELLGQPIEILIPDRLKHSHSKQRAAYEADPRLRTMGRERLNIVGLCKDGSELLVEIGLSPLKIQDRAMTAASIRDVSGRRSLERQLHRAQRMEAVGRLAGGVAHDFNNLLTVINGFAELALEKIIEDHPSRSDVEQVIVAGDRAAALTRQLLAFSRQLVLEPRVLDLNRIVREFEGFLRRAIGEGVELTTVLDPELGKVSVDSSQVEQILMNLAVNARDAMPAGGVLKIETANVELNEAYVGDALVVPGRYVLLATIDNGVGMDEETLSHIFEPFFTTKGSDDGTGLGLSTVYGIVRQSGGYARARSEPGRGARFEVYLPVVEDPVDVVTPSEDTALPPGGSETVLLVEDEKQVLNLLERFLEEKGYRVLAARHPQDALDVSRRHEGPIDLVVTDMVMPGGTGTELMERIAQERPETKALYISGYLGKRVSEKEPSGNVEGHFLKKPFSQNSLTEKVREILDSAT